jgi:hypothetical protein
MITNLTIEVFTQIRGEQSFSGQVFYNELTENLYWNVSASDALVLYKLGSYIPVDLGNFDGREQIETVIRTLVADERAFMKANGWL